MTNAVRGFCEKLLFLKLTETTSFRTAFQIQLFLKFGEINLDFPPLGLHFYIQKNTLSYSGVKHYIR